MGDIAAQIAGQSGLDAEESRFDAEEIGQALYAMNGEFVDLQITAGDPESWYVRRVIPAARRAVGQWPTPESLVEQLAAAFGDAADKEPDAEKKSHLLLVAGFLGTTGRDVATSTAPV